MKRISLLFPLCAWFCAAAVRGQDVGNFEAAGSAPSVTALPTFLARGRNPVLTFIGGAGSQNVILTAQARQGGQSLVYGSTDGGVGWKDVTNQLEGATRQCRFEVYTSGGSVMVSCAAMGASSDPALWISTDGGTSFSRSTLPPPVAAAAAQGRTKVTPPLGGFKYHPSDSTLVLASRNDPKCRGGGRCPQQIFSSSDSGKTWAAGPEDIVYFTWGDAASELVAPGVFYYSQIAAPELEKGSYKSRNHFSYQVDKHFYRTSALHDKNAKLLIENVHFIKFDGPYILAQMYSKAVVKSDSESSAPYSVWKGRLKVAVNAQFEGAPSAVSKGEITFKPAIFPGGEEFEGNAWEVYALYGGVALGYQSPRDKTARLFISDRSGTRFSESLSSLLCPSCVEKIEGVRGVYIANVHEFTDDAEPGQQAHKVRSVITFDSGASWGGIPAPVKFTDGADFDVVKDGGCEPSDNIGEQQCSLHVLNPKRKTNRGFNPRITGLAAGSGVFITRGIVSDKLDSSGLHLFITRDGGRTWSILRGKQDDVFNTVVAFSDHGAIFSTLSAAPAKSPGEQASLALRYSFDWCRTFSSVDFPRDSEARNVRVTGIHSHPSGASRKLIATVVGSDGVSVVTFDFSASQPRDCAGIDSPRSPNSDYEVWSPSSGTSACVLGQQLHYVRKKPTAACFNPPTFYEKVEVERNCPCTPNDFTCDSGFERGRDVDGHISCTRIDGSNAPLEDDECAAGGTFKVSKGYRLEAGSKCFGEKHVEGFAADEFPCLRVGTVGGLILALFSAVLLFFGLNACNRFTGGRLETLPYIGRLIKRSGMDSGAGIWSRDGGPGSNGTVPDEESRALFGSKNGSSKDPVSNVGFGLDTENIDDHDVLGAGDEMEEAAIVSKFS